MRSGIVYLVGDSDSKIPVILIIRDRSFSSRVCKRKPALAGKTDEEYDKGPDLWPLAPAWCCRFNTLFWHDYPHSRPGFVYRDFYLDPPRDRI
jgi:hypothetical protein